MRVGRACIFVGTVVVLAIAGSSAGAHPYGDNHGAAANPARSGSTLFTVNGIQARATVPTDVIDVAVACNGTTRVYLVIPEGCRINGNIRGGNLRPLQIVERTTATNPIPEFVATGFGGGCFTARENTNGSSCSGIGLNGQVYKKRYVDGRNEDFYYLTWYQTLNMGSTNSFIIRREYVNGTPYWRHFLNGGNVVITNQGDTMTQGFGSIGGESETVGTGLQVNVSVRFWDSISVKEPNGAYFVPGQILLRPHAPTCDIIHSATANRLEVTGRC